MADTSIWIDEIRVRFSPENGGQGDLRMWLLIRTDDHIGCPHFALGWKFKNFGQRCLKDVQAEMEQTPLSDVFLWESQEPPENDYGREITDVLEKNQVLTSFVAAEMDDKAIIETLQTQNKALREAMERIEQLTKGIKIQYKNGQAIDLMLAARNVLSTIPAKELEGHQ